MLKLIYGYHGSGKSTKMYEYLKDDIKKDKNAIFIVPEQMTARTERDVVQRLGNGASLLVEVTNFSRLADVVLRSFGSLCHRSVTEEEKKLGHGGMDYLEFKAFFGAILNDEEMPIDVYDAAAWMAITPLSEQSIALGGMPQAIPDFTRGAWLLRELRDVTPLPKPEK